VSEYPYTKESKSCVEAGYNTSTVELLDIEYDEKESPVPGGITGPSCLWEHTYRDLVLQVGGLDTRLTTLLCKKPDGLFHDTCDTIF
jgi:hypothetical protein